MNRGIRAALALLAATGAQAAWASDKQDFIDCDGRLQPGKQDDGMRGVAGTRGWMMPNLRVGSTEACTRALASPRLLPTQSIRRANLLRARAANYLSAGDTARALADLDAAEQAAGDRKFDRFYQRSMGVSLMLLRALAAAQTGDFATAMPLARQAMEARPYALQVQQIGAQILQAGRVSTGPSPSPWTSTVRLMPEAQATAILAEAEVGHFAEVVAARRTVELTWPDSPLSPFVLMSRTPEASRFLQSMILGMTTAYARAATGDPAGAQRDVAEIRARIATLRAAPTPGKTPIPVPLTLFEGLDKFVDVRARQVDARIAIAEGRHAEAIAALIASPMPTDGATIELLAALKASVPARDAALVPDPAPFREALAKQRREALLRLAPDALLAPETPRAVIDYERARPNILGALVGAAFSMGTTLLGGVGRTDGFRSTPNADGTVKVEFIGNTPSAPLVQEMTLLRAAEVAREAGKTGFVIVHRQDFSRSLQTTQYGSVVSSVPTGYKTELTIRVADAVPAAAGPALDTASVIDALGPFYYEAAAAAPAKRP